VTAIRPRRRLTIVLLAAALALAVAAGARAGEIEGSRLAFRIVRMEESGTGLLAQRSIVRDWGPSEDSTYAVVDLPGYKSEGWAMALSGAVPGAGHLYLGENGGLWFTLAEAAGWVSLWLFRDHAANAHTGALQYVGSPWDTTSAWSFRRYIERTGGTDSLALEQLYAGDVDAFYHRVAFDDRYLPGWNGASTKVRGGFRSLEDDYQSDLRGTRYARGLLILNHVVAAIDALRAAREHNLPIEQNLRIRLRGAISTGGPAMSVALERSF
jgi:hypothetical protein